MKKGIRLVLIALIAVSVIIIGYSGYRLYQIYHGYDEARESYSELSEQYRELTPPPPSVTEGGEEEVQKEKSPLSIDFDELHRTVNEEIVAWIWCPDTVIDYPVLQHEDDIFYLNADARGNASYNGAIFLGHSHFKNFSDRNNILHGHHMNDGSMFATLSDWCEEEYYSEHPVMYLNTAFGGNYKIEIFAAFTTPAESPAYRFEFTGKQDIEEWLQWLDQQSMIHPRIDLEATDRFVTLSTCAYSFANARSVVIGRLTPIE